MAIVRVPLVTAAYPIVIPKALGLPHVSSFRRDSKASPSLFSPTDSLMVPTRHVLRRAAHGFLRLTGHAPAIVRQLRSICMEYGPRFILISHS